MTTRGEENRRGSESCGDKDGNFDTGRLRFDPVEKLMEVHNYLIYSFLHTIHITPNYTIPLLSYKDTTTAGQYQMPSVQSGPHPEIFFLRLDVRAMVCAIGSVYTTAVFAGIGIV